MPQRVVTRPPGWHEVHPLIDRELGDRVHDPEPLTPVRQSRMTWAARAERTGPIVIKVRQGDDAREKTQRCAAHLPALGVRGYPVPGILWRAIPRHVRAVQPLLGPRDLLHRTALAQHHRNDPLQFHAQLAAQFGDIAEQHRRRSMAMRPRHTHPRVSR